METVAVAHRHVICWKSALGGLVLALVTATGLLALSVAFGGIALSDGTTLKRFTVLTSVCLVFSILIPAFTGAYYSVRVARQKIDLAGIAQGALVGGLFLLVVFCQTTSAVGTFAKAGGTMIAGAAAGAGEMASATMAQEIVEDSTGDLKFNSSNETVAKGVASRLLRDDPEGAKNYLAYQASLTPEQADQKIAAVKAKVDAAMVKAREATATAMKAAGWSLFLLTVLGMFGACLGGLVGTKANERYFLDTHHDEVVRTRSMNRQIA